MVEILRQIQECQYTDFELLNCKNLNEIGFDSIDLMRVAVECEDVFGITIDDENLTYDVLSNCQKLMKVIEAKIGDCNSN